MAKDWHWSTMRSFLAKLDGPKKTRATVAKLDRSPAFGSLSSLNEAGSGQQQDGLGAGSPVNNPLGESSTIISKNATTVGSTPIKRARQAIPPGFDILINEPCNDAHDSTPAFPTSVKCRMEVFLNGVKCRFKLESNLRWPDPDSYRTLSALMEEGLRDVAYYSLVSDVRSVSLARGDLTLFRIINTDSSGHEAEIEHSIFSHGRQLGDVISVMVSRFLAACPDAPFYLGIRYYFNSVFDSTTDKAQLAARIMQAMSSSYDGRQYLPQSELMRIISEDQIRELVYADSQLDQTMAQGPGLSADELVDEIIQHGIHLFALCVWSNTSFTVLERLLEVEFSDLHLPLNTAERLNLLIKTLDTRTFEDFISAQKQFYVLDFCEGGAQKEKHYDVPIYQTVPVHFQDPEDKLGEGSFAQVFKATIHPSHHSFTTTRSHCFAVKRFREYPHAKADFIHERDVMRILDRAPNNNIVTHLASWTHRENFFMLFPLAIINLATYLRTRPPQRPTKNFVFWLLNQLTNLAEGLAHIKNLTDAEASCAQHPGRSGGRNFGCHYDLKPANILIFSTGQGDAWKIGDFGAARISREVKGESNDIPLGDKVYEPPDWLLGGALSASYDVWSLGCIFLEVLVWFFWDLPGQGISEFEARRKADDSKRELPAYWRENPGRTGVALRPSVVSMMWTLEEQMLGFFRHVAITTTNMLNPDPKWRPDVLSIKSSLIAAGVQADLEMADLGPDNEASTHRSKTTLTENHFGSPGLSDRGTKLWPFDPERTLLGKEITLIAYAVTSEYYQATTISNLRRRTNHGDSQRSSRRNSGDRRSGRSSGSSQKSRDRHSSDL